MNGCQSSWNSLETSASLGFVVVAAFASALVWLWAMLGQLVAP